MSTKKRTSITRQSPKPQQDEDQLQDSSNDNDRSDSEKEINDSVEKDLSASQDEGDEEQMEWSKSHVVTATHEITQKSRKLDKGSFKSDSVKVSPELRSRKEKEPSPPTSPKRSDEPKVPQDDGSQTFKSTKSSALNPLYIVLLCLALGSGFAYHLLDGSSETSVKYDEEWRSKIDIHHRLSNQERAMISASMKRIIEKSSKDDQSVSTLLLLSANEETAARIGRCLLNQINRASHRGKLSTEIDLVSYGSDKLRLDRDLQSLLKQDESIKAVILRHVDRLTANEDFEQVRLLFAYCDGENPSIPHRLIIMTAKSNSQTEDELREDFKRRWPKEHDFIDALMSRISGHTVYIKADQKSICDS